MQFQLSFPDAPGEPPTLFASHVVRIGSGEANDVVVDTARFPGVERIHAELLADEHGAWIYDNQTRSGTWLDGQRVDKARVPQDGVLTIGQDGLRIRVRIGEEGPRTRAIRRDQAGLGVTTVLRLVREELGAAEPSPARTGSTRAIRQAVGEQSRSLRIAGGAALGFVLLAIGSVGYKLTHAERRVGQTERVLRRTEQVLEHERSGWRARMAQERRRTDRSRQELLGQVEQAREKALAADRQREALRKQVTEELAGIDVRGQQQELELRRRLLELRQRHEGQSREMQALKAALAQVRLAADPFARIMARYSPAIFIIGLRADSGRLVALGTGFAVRADGVLATNAHVSHELMRLVGLYRKLSRPVQAVAVMNNRPDQVFPIVDWLVHPRWVQGTVRSHDVSLVRLDMRGRRLPAVLPVATREELRRLQVGQAIAVVGFPGEVNDPYSPIATFKRGDIGRITTLEKGRGSFAEEILVQHSAPTTPGNSGSPILDGAGRVVAVHNAGIAIRLSIERRRVSFRPATGINWGLRADLILDLLERF